MREGVTVVAVDRSDMFSLESAVHHEGNPNIVFLWHRPWFPLFGSLPIKLHRRSNVKICNFQIQITFGLCCDV